MFPCKTRFGWECRSHLGEYTAKPNLPVLGLKRLSFLKLTLMVRFPNRTGYDAKTLKASKPF